MSGHKTTKMYVFEEGIIPIGFVYCFSSYIYTIEKENSYVYINYVPKTWYIACYTKIQYSDDTTIKVTVFYV